jgi:hypothetical protein
MVYIFSPFVFFYQYWSITIINVYFTYIFRFDVMLECIHFWYGVCIFSFRFLLPVLKYHHDKCIFHLYFLFWCHAWMHIFFLRGWMLHQNNFFFLLLFLLYLMCTSFSRFFSCFPFSSNFSSPPTLFLCKYQSLKVYFKFRV